MMTNIMMFLGGLTLVGAEVLIIQKLVKVIMETLELDEKIKNLKEGGGEEMTRINKDNKMVYEEDWEDDETLERWKDYPYDELDSRDE
jgi:hypothetical protein